MSVHRNASGTDFGYRNHERAAPNILKNNVIFHTSGSMRTANRFKSEKPLRYIVPDYAQNVPWYQNVLGTRKYPG